jgi:hypothetical protein
MSDTAKTLEGAYIYHGYKNGRHGQRCSMAVTDKRAGHLCVVTFEDGVRMVVSRQHIRAVKVEREADSA